MPRAVTGLILFLALMATLYGYRATAEQPSLSEQTIAASTEFCGPSSPPKQATLNCPRTGAILCLCYLRGQTAEPFFEDIGVTRVSATRVLKPAQKVVLLAEITPPALKASVETTPPTPPPRA